MQVTRFTDLGLRILMLLAAGEFAGQRVTARTVAAGANASEHHVAKAVSRLADLGMVHARRGRVGGVTLTEAGRRAPIGWLVRHLDNDREVVDCDDAGPCPLVPGCRLRAALTAAKEAFYRELDNHTVLDLVSATE